MQSKSVAFIKGCVFFFNAIIGVTGVGILAVSVRLLVDPDFSHILFQGNDNHSSGHLLIAAGAVMALVGLIGCVGAWRESPCLLGFFLLFVLLFLTAELAVGILVYTKAADFHERVHFSIFWGVQRHYGNDVSNTTILDFLQQTWKCCGLNSYTSWSNSMYSKMHVPKGAKTTNVFIVPKSCCVDPKSDTCEQVHLKGVQGSSDPVAHILHSEGCGPKLMNSLHIYTKYALISSISFVSAEVIAIALSAFFIYSIKHGHSIRFKWIKASSDEEPPQRSKMGSPSTAPSYTASRSSLILDPPVTSLV